MLTLPLAGATTGVPAKTSGSPSGSLAAIRPLSAVSSGEVTVMSLVRGVSFTAAIAIVTVAMLLLPWPSLTR